MRALRLVLNAGVLVALIGGSGGAVIAQDETARSNYTPIAGRSTDFSADDSGSYGWHDSGNWYVSGLDTRITVEWSDPRLPPEVVGLMSGGGFDSETGQAGQVVLGQWLLEGPDGYWSGPVRHYYDVEAAGHGMAWLTGHDAYENLTALLMSTSEPDCATCLAFEGAIFEGAMPTMPDPLETPAE